MGIHKHSSGVYPGRGLAQARMFHESPAPDRGYGRPSLRAVGSTSRKPGVLGCSFGQAQDRLPLRRTVQVRLGSNPLWLPGGTPISTVSRRRFVKHPGQRLKQAGINSHRTRRNS
ncbi:MAG: hypothetical protein WBG24_20330 [Syntrophobacteria bacterium]